MRIFTIGDIHIDTDHPDTIDVIKRLSFRVMAMGQKDDLLVINGDIADTDEDYAQGLNLFGDFKGTKAVIAGNHDLFVHAQDPRTSLQRYNGLAQICQSHSFQFLDNEPLLFPNFDLAVVGNMGWYDFSFCKNPKHAKNANDSSVLQDNETGIKWEMSDQNILQMMLEKLKKQLEQVVEFKTVIVFVHHWPTKELLPQHLFRPKAADMAYGFWGSQLIGDLIAQYPNVKVVFTGHTHIQKEKTIGNILYRSIASLPNIKELLMYAEDAVYSILIN